MLNIEWNTTMRPNNVTSVHIYTYIYIHIHMSASLKLLVWEPIEVEICLVMVACPSLLMLLISRVVQRMWGLMVSCLLTCRCLMSSLILIDGVFAGISVTNKGNRPRQ